MNKVKKALSVFIAIIIILSVFTVVPVNAAEAQRFGKSILSRMDNSSALIFVYDKLVEAVKNSTEKISIQSDKYKVTWDEVATVYRLFYSDYPEYFWIDGACNGSVNSSTNIALAILPNYTISGNALKKAKTDFEAKVKSLTSGLSGKSDYEKALILHDRLAAATDYVFTDNDQNAYGALVEGKAVCAGYARAYQHLMNSAGLTAWYVSGSSVNPATNKSENHAWNLVSISGNWYFTDVTWDDQGEKIYYGYFNNTSAQINEDHTPGEFGKYLPVATATADNYFVKNNLVFSGVDTTRIANLLKTNGNTIRIYVTGDLDKFEKDLENNMRSIIKNMGVPNNLGYSYRTSILGREILLNLEIKENNHTHKPTVVAAKKPSCTSNGNIQYYSCYCGKIFSDAAGTAEITDKSTVVLSPVAHTPSDTYMRNSDYHWKVCKICDTEIAGTNTLHADANTDGVCDTCNEEGDFAEAPPILVPENSTPSANNATPVNTEAAAYMLYIVIAIGAVAIAVGVLLIIINK